jgi:hypothetical protein
MFSQGQGNDEFREITYNPREAAPLAVALGSDLVGKITGVDINDQNGLHPIWRSGDPTTAQDNTVLPVEVQVGSSWEIRVYFTFTATTSGSSSWAATAIVSGAPLNQQGNAYPLTDLIGINSYLAGETNKMDKVDIGPAGGFISGSGFNMPNSNVTITRIKLFGSPNHVWTAKPDFSLW